MGIPTSGTDTDAAKNRLERPSRQRRSARRGQLLQAALELFSEKPYEDISVDEVCARAGVAHGLVSYYFDGKRGLFAAAVEHAWADLVSYELPLDSEVTAADRVRGYLARHFEYARNHPDRFRLMMRTGHADEQITEILRAARSNAVREVAGSLGCPSDDRPLLRAAMSGWTGYVDTVTEELLHNRHLSVPSLTDMCVQVLVASVRAATGVAVDQQTEIEALSVVATDTSRLAVAN